MSEGSEGGAAPTDAQAGSSRVLVPLHADSWALALASGYVGSSIKADPAEDVQSLGKGAIVGFFDKVPRWAIEEGESGPRVMLMIASPISSGKSGEVVFLDGPMRITSVQEAMFSSKAELDGFKASMGPFPDVAQDLVPSTHEEFPLVESEKPSSIEPTGKLVTREEREKLDFLAGWSAALVELLEEGDLDEAITGHLSDKISNTEELARSILLAIDKDSDPIDQVAWSSTVNSIASRYRARGFDRQNVLDEVHKSLEEYGEEASRWVKGAQAVINAERDLPDFGDAEHVGRRAALALLLVHEPTALKKIEENLGVGPRTRALVTLATYAFTGLAKLDKAMKSPMARLNGTLAIAEALSAGTPARFKIEQARIGADLSRHWLIQVGGETVVERISEPPHHLLMLKARAQEAGYTVKVDAENGNLSISSKSAKAPAIAIWESVHSTSDHPVVDLVLTIGKLGARPSIALLKSYLELAATNATTIGLRETGKAQEIVAVASIPLATLDRDEMTFHVERLLSIYDAKPGGKKKAKSERQAGLPGI